MTPENIFEWLEEIKDPEIPVLSLVDLGVIKSVTVNKDQVTVVMTPTFVGCPALQLMKQEIESVLHTHGVTRVAVEVTYEQPWTSDDISEKGKVALKRFGLAPPPARVIIDDLDILDHVHCPRCGGTNTELKTPFGATLCRSMHYCHDCREAFEQFKPL